MANGRESPIKQNGAQILKIVIVILRITSLMMNDEAICFIIIQYRSRSLTCICLMSFFLAASSITDVSHERGSINVYVHLLYTSYIYIYIICIYTSSMRTLYKIFTLSFRICIASLSAASIYGYTQLK